MIELRKADDESFQAPTSYAAEFYSHVPGSKLYDTGVWSYVGCPLYICLLFKVRN